MTYEGLYVIFEVPDDWREGDPFPPASPNDHWFDKLPDFVAALDGPWDHVPIRRSRWVDPDVVEVPQRRVI
jgi:hypothetical protein